MIALIVDLRVRPGHRDRFLAAIEENARRSVADEPGCLTFEVCQDQQDDHHFFLYEIYRDADAYAAHRAAPHFAEWRRAADEHLVPGSQNNVLADRLFEGTEAL